DDGQFQQILINLAVNARDAMPDGGRLVLETENLSLPADARRFPELASGQYVSLTVSDTGPGMDESTQKHLFEPFFTTKGPGKGTGLGLATCHGIVKQNGGYIVVDTRLGAGATFRIILPRIDDVKPVVSEVKPVPHNDGTETILVVEDDHALCDFIV